MTSYFRYEYSNRTSNVGGTVFYKLTEGVYQRLEQGKEPISTNLISAVGKSANEDGTASYYLWWMNSIYEGCVRYDSDYYTNLFEPLQSNTSRRGSSNPSDYKEYYSTYIAVLNTIKSYYDNLKSLYYEEAAQCYYSEFTPTYLLFPASKTFLSSGKSGGTTVQVVGNNKNNKNFCGFSVIVGSSSQTDQSPIKRFYNWFGESSDVYTTDIRQFDREYEIFMSTGNKQIEGENDLYPIWPVNDRFVGEISGPEISK